MSPAPLSTVNRAKLVAIILTCIGLCAWMVLGGCALMPQAVQNQMEKERWAQDFHRGLMSEADYVDACLTQEPPKAPRRLYADGRVSRW